MIKHIVMWKLRETAEGNDRAHNALLAKAKLEALAGRIPGLLKIEVGINFCEEDAAADIVLYSEFTDRAALDAYQVHPEHEAVKTFVMAIKSARHMVDYEVE